MKNMSAGKRVISHSQNFLRDPKFVKSLINKTDLTAGELIVEVGSGKGIVTELLAEKGCQVIGVELDDRLFANLVNQLKSSANVEIVKADFLKWNLPSKPYKVFSNIPFNMTTDIITKLLYSNNPPELAYLILQDKAAERFIGDPLAKDTQMSILLKPYFEMAIVSKIDKKQFSPVPNIGAVLAMFKKRPTPLVERQNSQLFRDFVIYGYNQWKPTVLEAFAKVFTPKQISFLERKAGFRGAKPRDLTIDQWLTLFESFVDYVPEDKKNVVRGAEKKLKNQQRVLQKWHRTR